MAGVHRDRALLDHRRPRGGAGARVVLRRLPAARRRRLNPFATHAAALPWAGSRITVLGLARAGEACARALVAQGASVTVLDASDAPAQRERAAGLAGARVLLGREDAADVGAADLVVSSPGVPPHSPWITAAQDAGIPVWSDIELAYRLGALVEVAITGTNGKTTTTDMTAAGLNAAGLPAVAAGNIGTALVTALDAERVVAEVSSFQLERIVAFRARVAVLLNIAHDHIDWHGSFERYAAAKHRIFENQRPDDIAVVHASCAPYLVGAAARTVVFSEHEVPRGGAGVADGWIVVPEGRVVEYARLAAPGRANRANAVAAAAAACALGADPTVVGEALAAFRLRPHRTEHVAVIEGVTYVNDSKATDPHATLAALAEMQNVVLIAGGLDRSGALEDLTDAAPKLRAVVVLGRAADALERVFASSSLPVIRAESMDDAVERSRALARPGDTVLLSPACASLDMYASYEERGNAFRAAVARIGETTA